MYRWLSIRCPVLRGVMSEWYPATSAPKSIFTKSPAASIAPVGR
ncbi:Uncharacterised protein [Mycobacteroides abscessus subsp. abscessus]|nr:Uncharacterised protein [Mycobacteroides abscessus subsp. abscessus]